LKYHAYKRENIISDGHYLLLFFTGEDDLADIIEEIISIRSVYFSLGRSLRLRPDNLRAISESCSSTGACDESDADTERALNDVILLWLRQRYNVERFGPPTWRMLVEAVDKHTGGNDHELAKKIALNHPKGKDG
jgi:hypothetical protein